MSVLNKVTRCFDFGNTIRYICCLHNHSYVHFLSISFTIIYLEKQREIDQFMVCRGVILVVLFEINPSFEFLLTIIPDIMLSLWAERLQKSEQNVSLNLLLKTP